MKIMVTGASGFLGQALWPVLKHEFPDAELRAYHGDLTDPGESQLGWNWKPDLIIHLAARVGGIGANQASPGTFFRDNILMGVNVLDAAKTLLQRGHKARVVMIGTCCSYPRLAPNPLVEEDLWAGYPEMTNSAYGIAKRSLITMAEAYRQQFGMDIVTVIPANLYGPGDNFSLDTSHVIPAMVRKFIDARDAGRDVVLWGTGTASREFLYVDDAARGIALVAKTPDLKHAVYNMGSGDEINMSLLSIRIRELTGYRGPTVFDVTKPDGQLRRLLDSDRIRVLGFQAQVPLIDGLAKTVQWYDEHKTDWR
jgi:GDP-L-fucose synthase